MKMDLIMYCRLQPAVLHFFAPVDRSGQKEVEKNFVNMWNCASRLEDVTSGVFVPTGQHWLINNSSSRGKQRSQSVIIRNTPFAFNIILTLEHVHRYPLDIIQWKCMKCSYSKKQTNKQTNATKKPVSNHPEHAICIQYHPTAEELQTATSNQNVWMLWCCNAHIATNK